MKFVFRSENNEHSKIFSIKKQFFILKKRLNVLKPWNKLKVLLVVFERYLPRFVKNHWFLIRNRVERL
jgi:hypothetical protein